MIKADLVLPVPEMPLKKILPIELIMIAMQITYIAGMEASTKLESVLYIETNNFGKEAMILTNAMMMMKENLAILWIRGRT